MKKKICIHTLALAWAAALPSAPAFAQPACDNRCHADWNENCSRSTQDIFDFLFDYFSPGLTADFNCDGAKGVQDIFDFLAAYFGGCALHRDLNIIGVGLPDFVVPGCSFGALVTVRNDGTCPISGEAAVSCLFSADSSFGDANDVWIGSLPIFIAPPIEAKETRQLTLSFTLPSPMSLQTQHARFCISGPALDDDSDITNNCMTRQIPVSCPDIGIANVSVPSGAWNSGQTRPIAVTVANYGPCTVHSCATIAFGTAVSPAACADVPEFGSRVISVSATAPAAASVCGQPINFTMRACVTTPTCDSRPENNWLDRTVGIVGPYWDLSLAIGGPSTFNACQVNHPLNYTVTVTNLGNSYCPGVTVCSALVDDDSSSCANHVPNPGIACFPTVGLNAGSSTVLDFGYAFTCGFNCGQQRLKAWISSGDGCSAGNCDSNRITIFGGCRP